VNKFAAHIQAKSSQPTDIGSEVDKWLRSKTSHHSSAKHYWKDISVFGQFTVLSKIARGIYAIPRANGECERDFSDLTLLLDKRRRRMKKSTIERRLWLKLNRGLWDPNPDFCLFSRRRNGGWE